jgi:hypothetical protein
MVEATTLQINNNMIIINLSKIDEDVFHDSDKQKIVILLSYLGGYNINYCNRTITLYLSLKGLYSFTVDFDRGGIDSRISQANFNSAVALLGS